MTETIAIAEIGIVSVAHTRVGGYRASFTIPIRVGWCSPTFLYPRRSARGCAYCGANPEAAMRKADTWNAMELRQSWPHVWANLQKRYNAPGGWLEGDPEESNPQTGRNQGG